MATVIETVERDNRTILVYDNGMERDANTGRMVRAPTAAMITTPEKSNELLRKRLELKRERLAAGAARSLERTGEWTAPNDLDVVEAIGEAVMQKALDPKNAKQVDAARFILDEAGFSERQARSMDESPVDAVRGMLADLAALAGSVARLKDGLLTETGIPASNNHSHSSADESADSPPSSQDNGDE